MDKLLHSSTIVEDVIVKTNDPTYSLSWHAKNVAINDCKNVQKIRQLYVVEDIPKFKV